jgi:hypothetical protein
LNPEPAFSDDAELIEVDVAARAEGAKNFGAQLLKGIKQIGMYRHAENKYPEFLRPALEALETFTQTYGALVVVVEQQRFSAYGESLFGEEPSPLPYRFYRDGIRQLIFRPGLTKEELTSFTLIAVSDPERGEDALAQLWRTELEHLEYLVVEGFHMDSVPDDQVQVEVERVVGYLQGRLRSQTEDSLRFARVSTEDLDARLEGIEQLRGAVITGETADDTLKAALQRELEEEESNRLFPKLVSAVFQVIETGAEDAPALEDMFIQLLDAMLLQEDFTTINQMVLKLKAMERGEHAEAVQRLREGFVLKMAEDHRLTRIGDILKSHKPKRPAEVTRYLSTLDGTMVPTLLSVLETIGIPENRQLICDLLVPFAKMNAQPFQHRLTVFDKPQTVRDMVYILDKTQAVDRFKMLEPVLASSNLALRLEVLAIIARGRTPECHRMIASALEDPVQQMRIVSAKLLAELEPELAFRELHRIVREKNFSNRTAEEKGALYAALGSTGQPGALSLISQILQVRPNLFNKQKVLEDKLLAIQGLQGACTIQTLKLLQTLVEDKNQGPELTMAAKRAVFRVKKELFGEPGAGGGEPEAEGG